MNTTIRQDALSESLNDTQNLIYNITHKFISKYGYNGNYQLHFEELIAETNLSFITAFDNYDSARANFTTWIYFVIWHRLLNTLHSKSIRPTQTIEPENTEIFKMPSPLNNFKFVEILIDASQDAHYIINLVISSSDDLQKIMSKYGKGNRPRNTRAAIRRFLLKTGWTVERVREKARNRFFF